MAMNNFFDELFGKKNNNSVLEGVEELPTQPEEELPTQIQIDEGKIIGKIINNPNMIFKDLEDKFTYNPIKITDKLPIKYPDKFFIEKINNCDFDIFTNLFFIFKAHDNTLVAYGNLYSESDNDTKYYLIINDKNISHAAFKSNNQYRIGLLDKNQDLNNINHISTFNVNIEYKELNISDRTLCIDFGTSNTCAGSYGVRDVNKNEIELVQFENNQEESNIYPTIVYVDDCSDPDNVQYLFGYKAYSEVIKKNYDTKASVFFEIKRFMTSCNQDEKITDEKGNTVTIKRRELIKAYLYHIIDLSKHYFKADFEKIHFSAPVKLKELFYKELRLIFRKNYKILIPQESLDEGIAIVYNNIQNKIQSLDESDKLEDFKIMIMDCGGGTSDLASCKINYAVKNATKTLTIDSKFLHGDSNFGGNNITYRILQLIKIKICSNFNATINYDLNDLIPHLDNNAILEGIETSTINNFEDENHEVYGNFNKNYGLCENIIPTQFKVDEFNNIKTANDIKKIKRNYYYLWKLAEEIKIKFFEKQKSVNLNFDLSTPNFDNRLDLNVESHYIFTLKDNKLVEEKINTSDIEITIKELERLLIGEIYGLLYKVFKPNKDYLEELDKLKLSGQSCKINLFNDLLKEFIAGHKLREGYSSKQTSKKDSTRFKQECIIGCIGYLRDKESGFIDVEINPLQPKLNYSVIVNQQPEPKLLDINDSSIKLNKFIKSAINFELTVYNTKNEIQREIKISCPDKRLIEIDLDKLKNRVSKIGHIDSQNLRKLIDDLHETEPNEKITKDNCIKILFAVQSNEGYGMHIFIISKKREDGKDIYTAVNPIYENFEFDDGATKTFFDGSR